ncbi:MAG: hypothetical protein IJH39_00620 [Clostridia bacterium]|nr:hypothetical protein [Clostridia bacterium]
MRINYVKTIGFRKFKGSFETDLYDITNITGKNRSGKSNILYAIVNTILGTNLNGNEKICLINKDADASYCEVKFTDNNDIEHSLIRAKHKYSNKENYLLLDGRVITQDELVSFYKDKKLFLSIVNPLYFLGKKTAEQKEIVDKYLSDIAPKDIMEIAFNNLSNEEKNILETIPQNIPTFIIELNADIKNAENSISTLDGKIDYATSIANMEINSKKIFDKIEELSLARQELSFLNTNKDIVDKEKQKELIVKLEKEVLDKENEQNELSKSMRQGKEKYNQIKNGTLCVCPTCNQHIENESKLKTIENMKHDLIIQYNRNILLESQLKDLKIKLTKEKCIFHSLEGNTTIEKTKRIHDIEQSIKELEQENLEIEKFNSEIAFREKTKQDAKNDITKFNVEKAKYKQFIDSLNQAKKVAQKLYINYIEEKMKLAKQYLKDVDIKFYTVLKTTGEIKEDFIITYKNTPLADLSRSETIAVALEFANMFNKISKVNLPIFIDDYESCADYDFIGKYAKDTQLITCTVKKGQALKISNNTGELYTVIKPVIKSFKTLKLYKNNNAEIRKAA